MRLIEIIEENNKSGQQLKNQELVRLRLKELAFSYPKEVKEVLNKTGVKFSSVLPASVLYAILIKHAPKNEKLRDAISKMLLEMDGYLRADGQWAGIIGGALSAVGSVVSGIGQGQYRNSDDQLAMQQLQIEREAKQREDEAKRRRTTWLILGVSALAIIGLIVFIRSRMKAKIDSQLKPTV